MPYGLERLGAGVEKRIHTEVFSYRGMILFVVKIHPPYVFLISACSRSVGRLVGLVRWLVCRSIGQSVGGRLVGWLVGLFLLERAVTVDLF